MTTHEDQTLGEGTAIEPPALVWAPGPGHAYPATAGRCPAIGVGYAGFLFSTALILKFFAGPLVAAAGVDSFDHAYAAWLILWALFTATFAIAATSIEPGDICGRWLCRPSRPEPLGNDQQDYSCYQGGRGQRRGERTAVPPVPRLVPEAQDSLPDQGVGGESYDFPTAPDLGRPRARTTPRANAALPTTSAVHAS